MKLKHLLLTAMFFATYAGLWAQSLESRNEIKKSVGAQNLTTLKKQFLDDQVKKEALVAKYLKANPEVKRSFTKNGSLYYLKEINADGHPIYINTKNRESGKLIKADQLYSGGSIGANISGTNMVVGVWDGGQVRASHELLSGKVAMQANQTYDGSGGKYGGNNHQTHVTGTIVGKKLANRASAQGIAYDATAQNYDWTADKAEMTDFANQGYLISNHSYGYTNGEGDPIWQFGAYDSEARAWDVLLKNAPNYLPFVAVGNEQDPESLDDNNKHINGNWLKLGYDIITGSSASKNALTVGAVNGDKSMSDYSNWGPTDDGRVKPEIVAKGTGINSSYFALKGTSTPSDTAYSGTVGSQGTSYATPAAAGAALLLQQYYHSLYGSYMKASTLKALLLTSAEDLGQPGPDPKFGWGLLNAEKAANAIKQKSNSTSPANKTHSDMASKGAYIEEITYNPTNNSTDEMTRTVTASGCEPLVVAIGWTDDAGTEQLSGEGVDPTTSRLVYDFDIVVRQDGTNTDLRPWKPSSLANRTANATLQTSWFDGNPNNYKQIIIMNPVAGATYTVYIRKKSSSPTEARMLSLIITGTSKSAAPTLAANPASINSGSSSTLTATGCEGGTITWLTTPTQTGASISVSPTQTTTYKAHCTIGTCKSPEASIAVEVKTTTPPPVGCTAPTLAANPASINSGSSSTLTATGCEGGTITWLTTPTQTGTSISVSPTQTTTYKAYCTIGTCKSAEASIAVEVKTTTPPPPPTPTPAICIVDKVRLKFRNDCCFERLQGATIQGSTNGSDWRIIYTINSNGTGAWQEFSFNNTTAYSQVRFVAGPIGFGELYELSFYNGNTKLSGNGFGSVGSNANNGSEKALDGLENGAWWHGSNATPGAANYVGLVLDQCGNVPPVPVVPTTPTSVCVDRRSDIGNPSETGTYMINVPASGVYTIRVTYASWERPAGVMGMVSVNSSAARSISLAASAGQESYRDVTFTQALVAGNNSLRFSWGDGFYRIRKVCAEAGEANSSRAVQSTKRTQDIVKDGLIAYPNPATMTLYIDYQLNHDGQVELNLYDMMGLSRSKINLIGRAGANTTSMDVEQLPIGFYLLKLQTNEGSKTRKVILQR